MASVVVHVQQLLNDSDDLDVSRGTANGDDRMLRQRIQQSGQPRLSDLQKDLREICPGRWLVYGSRRAVRRLSHTWHTEFVFMMQERNNGRNLLKTYVVKETVTSAYCMDQGD